MKAIKRETEKEREKEERDETERGRGEGNEQMAQWSPMKDNKDDVKKTRILVNRTGDMIAKNQIFIKYLVGLF